MVGPLFATSTGTLGRSHSQIDSESTTSRYPRPPFKSFLRQSSTPNKDPSASSSFFTTKLISSKPQSSSASTSTVPKIESSPNAQPSTIPESNNRTRPTPRSPRIPMRRPSLPLPLRRPSSPLSPSQNSDFPWGHICVRPENENAHGSCATPAKPGERELLVIAHGLQGQAEDFNFVLETLRNSEACKTGQLVIHTTRVNTDRTHDGVAAGGMRLATDIRAAINRAKLEGQPVDRLSMLGFSLGGVYVRYAAAELFDGERGTFAGLKGGSMVLVASPHLGVRKFGVYRFVPELVRGVKVLGDTVREMMLMDDEKILERMCKDDDKLLFDDDMNDGLTSADDEPVTGGDENDDENEKFKNSDNSVGRRGRRTRKRLLFMSSLKAFEFRVLYSNVRNDLMVNFGTAALEPAVSAVGGTELERVLRGAAAYAVDSGHDDKGCKVCFRYWMRDDVKDEKQLTLTGTNSTVDDDAREIVMAERLRSIGWWVVGVDFPLALPIAHNRIVAMNRNWVHGLLNSAGRRCVYHLVDMICSRYDCHESKFCRTDSDGDIIESFV